VSALAKRKENAIYGRIREILESARAGVARTVNTTQVMANWLIGREIVEEEQRGKRRADYGALLIEELSQRLQADFERGFTIRNLETFRQFYLNYPELAGIPHALRAESSTRARASETITHAVSAESEKSDALRRISSASISAAPQRISQGEQKSHPARGKSATAKGHALRSFLGSPFDKTGATNQIFEVISNAVRSESWQPGMLHPNLSWTHYRTLLRVDRGDTRAFYEIEAIRNNWSARELERQINSLLYERLAKSRDKAGLMRLATKGHEIQRPEDVFKDPVVIEFLGLPESHRLVESNLEEALITNLQLFLLELGKGFAFVSRQERITLEGDHFYIDLVFYHTVLKCYVLIDLKVGKLTHGDLGQLQLYVNYFDQERRTEGDNPTLGLILCTDKNDTVVKYTLGPDQGRKIFASRYKLHLPTEAELKAELRRELKELESP
jgi:predicted nuclease of restriction endonuclease-like (RecB) superfamily